MIAAAHAHQYTPTVTSVPQAPRYIHFHGREIRRGVGFLRGAVIKCPDHHVVKPDSIVLHGVLFCDHRPQRHHAECGALIYMIAMPSLGNPLHRIWLADLTRAEWEDMQRLGLTDPDSVFQYFDAAFAR